MKKRKAKQQSFWTYIVDIMIYGRAFAKASIQNMQNFKKIFNIFVAPWRNNTFHL